MIIQYDGTNLNSSPYFVEVIPHDSWAGRQLTTKEITEDRGVIVLDEEFDEKTFNCSGRIIGENETQLRQYIDSLSELLARNNKNLAITEESSGVTRQYLAYVRNLNYDRKYYTNYHIPFSFEFVIPRGFGINPTAESTSQDDITDTTFADSIDVVGSAYPRPNITLTFDSATNVSEIEVLVNGDAITITETISANDIIIINSEDKKVTLNGDEIDYAGKFPFFLLGTNLFQVDVTSTSHQYDFYIEYYKTYL